MTSSNLLHQLEVPTCDESSWASAPKPQYVLQPGSKHAKVHMSQQTNVWQRIKLARLVTDCMLGNDKGKIALPYIQ